MNQNTITIIVADDHELIRGGFLAMFEKIEEYQIVATVADGGELIEAVDRLRPQIVVTDIKMEPVDGIEATKKIKEKHPDIKILGLSAYDEEILIRDMIAAGANGYLLKNAPNEEWLTAFKSVLAGKDHYCAKTSAKLLRFLNEAALKSVETVPLTSREKEVLILVVAGKTSRQIGEVLFISTKTVEKHREALMKKTGSKNVIELADFARKNGYVK